MAGLFCYINEYYENNLTTGQVATYYYPISSTGQALGDRLVAKRTGEQLNYIHQDHLGGTWAISDDDGELVDSMTYLPYGECLQSQGTLTTDRLFTGQRLDGTGLYYYGARYYDPAIGRFVSPDTFVQNSTGFNSVSTALSVNIIPQSSYPSSSASVPSSPQALNRYSYVLNNPLRYTDPSGWWTFGIHISLNFKVVFSVNIGASFLWDTHRNWALTSDSPNLEISTAKSASFSVAASTTSKDTIFDLLNERTYTTTAEIGEMAKVDPALIFDDGGLIGGSLSGGLGAQWPPVGLTMGFSDPPADIIGSNEMFENYSGQQFMYDMINTFISPDAAYDFDYYYDGTIDYGYNYDQYYYDWYYGGY